jgi:Domain of unknown function (DUF4160)
VPTICVFYGVVIQMFWRDHNPPHFHALYGGDEVLIDLRDLSTLRGSMPRRAMSMVSEWAAEHHEELLEDWELCRQLRTPNQIEPLR